MAVFALDEQLVSLTKDPEQNTFEAKVAIHSSMLAFDGHFPGEPVLPGIVQVQIARELVEDLLGKEVALSSITRARMSMMVVPGDQLLFDGALTAIEDDQRERHKARLLIYKEGRLASRLSFVVVGKH